MARFTIEGLPRPVIIQELDAAAAKALRLGDFVDRMTAAGIDYDVAMLEANPGVIAAETAAYGDLYFVSMLNDAARVTLLSSFAEGSDLDLHATRIGLERQIGESDVALRERVRLAWKGKSAAGADDYYISAARNFSPLIRDVAVTAETRNFSSRVLILSVLTSDNGGQVTDEMRAGLSVVLNDPSFRPRNVASVEVVPAVITAKNVAADIYLYPETPDSVVELARQALVAAVSSDQTLGFDITRSYVEKHLHQSGVQRVELQGWTDAYATFNEAVRIGSITLTAFRLAE